MRFWPEMMTAAATKKSLCTDRQNGVRSMAIYEPLPGGRGGFQDKSLIHLSDL
jgi:hypothetical protein